MATVIDRLIATLSLDGAGFNRGLQQAQQKAKSFGSTVATDLKSSLGGAFAATAVIAFTKSVVDAAGEIQDLAERLNLTTDMVQKLEQAGSKVGVSMGSIESGLTKLMDNLQTGAKGVPEALESLGLNLEQIQGMSMDQALNEIAAGMDNLATSGQRAEAALALIGSRGGLKFLQTLQASREELPMMASETVTHLDAIGDEMSAIKKRVMGAAGNFLSGVAGDATSVSGFTKLLGGGVFEKGLKAFGQAMGIVDMDRPTPNPGGDAIGGSSKSDAAFSDKIEKSKEWMAIQDEILKLEEETTKNFETSRVARLTTEERRNELLEERLKLTEKLAQLDASGVDFARTMNRVSEIDTALVQLKPEEAVKARGFGGSVSSDSLTAIGGFTGGSSGAASVSDKLSTVADILRRVENLMDGQGIKIRKF